VAVFRTVAEFLNMARADENPSSAAPDRQKGVAALNP